MCWDEKVERRQTHCGSDAAMREGFADGARHVGIGDELAESERRNGPPHRDAKGRAAQFKREVEATKPAREVRSHLSACFAKQRIARFTRGEALASHKIACDDRGSVAYDQQIATKRRGNAVRHRRIRNNRDRSGVLIVTT